MFAFRRFKGVKAKKANRDNGAIAGDWETFCSPPNLIYPEQSRRNLYPSSVPDDQTPNLQQLPIVYRPR